MDESLEGVAGPDQAVDAAGAGDEPRGLERWLPVRWEVGAYLSLLAVALAMRLWDLGSRAMHHDESMHALFSFFLSQGRAYEHNPLLHGPFQFHANALTFFLLGDSDVTARLLSVLFGTALVGLPWFLRGHLGRTGALVTSLLLAFSPTMLYFSRFARNDILMAVWVLGIVIALWRYLDHGRHRDLYVLSALLALAFATKETIYLSVTVFGAFLLLVSVPWRRRRRGLGRDAPFDPSTALRAGAAQDRPSDPPEDPGQALLTTGLVEAEEAEPSGAVRTALRPYGPTAVLGLMRARLVQSRSLVLLLLLVTLSLPLGSALVGAAQGLFGLELVNSDFTVGRVGLPVGATATGVAVAVTGLAFLVAAAAGVAWDWRRWLVCAGIFYGIWTFLYTSVFTNGFGVWTGLWQGLGYWLAQQGVARGGQPWFYYIITGWTYEFLPLVAGLAGMAWYSFRGDRFTRFLIFWALGTFFLFTLAAEKMPWLLVHLTLPMVLLAGRSLGSLLEWMPWRRLAGAGPLMGVALVPLFLLLAYRLLFFEPGTGSFLGFLRLWGWFLVVFGVLLLILYLTTRRGWRQGLSLVAMGVTAVLLVLTVRAGLMVTYAHGDVPTEMLVYTQTSPEVAAIARDLGRIAESTGRGQELPIAVDGQDGFGWPWYWYLRDYTSVSYQSYSDGDAPAATDRSVVIVNANNDPRLRDGLAEEYVQVKRFAHRWWFPETYRSFTPGVVLGALVDRDDWRKVMDYWLFREFETPLGSADAYLYYSKDLATASTVR